MGKFLSILGSSLLLFQISYVTKILHSWLHAYYRITYVYIYIAVYDSYSFVAALQLALSIGSITYSKWENKHY